MRKTIRALLLIACAFQAGMCQAQANNSKSILVAHPVDFTGPGADFGRDYSLGAKVYFDHINATGGIKGRRINYRAMDTAGLPARALSNAQGALNERNESVIFGVTGDNAVEALAKDNKVRTAGAALFGAVAGNTSLGPDDGVFYLRASLGDEVRAIVGQLKNLGISNFGLASADEYMREASSTLNAEAGKLGIRVVSEANLPISAEGASTAASKIAAARPQAVIVIGDTLSAAQFFKRYRSLDPGAFLCAPSMVNFRTLTSAIGPQAARGLIISQVVPDTTATLDVTREHKKLMEKYADEPSSPATLEGFIAAKLLVSTLQKAGETSASAIRQSLLGDGKISVGGYELSFGKNNGGRPSRFVELSVMTREGRLLR